MPKSATASVTPISAAAASNPQRVNQFIQRARLAKSAAEIAAAIDEADQLAGVVSAELADAKRVWGEKLLDTTPEDREAHDRLVRALGHETEQLAAIGDTLRTRLAEAEQREELATGDAKLARAVELAKTGRRLEAAYETGAKKVAADLSSLAAASDEFRSLERDLDRLGRTEELNLAIAEQGGPPGAVKGIGLLHDASDPMSPVVRLPAISRDVMIWGPR
jgi:hypothetical protein